MTLAIIAGVVFLGHVAIWLGVPSNRVNESAPADMSLESA
jgi:hypothetical protein